VVSQLIVDPGVYHHIQVAVSHNLFEKKVKWAYVSKWYLYSIQWVNCYPIVNFSKLPVTLYPSMQNSHVIGKNFKENYLF
jgi:cbb3-type cytochrome oxidase subunit 1